MPYVVCKKTLIIEPYKSQKFTKEETSNSYMPFYALCGSKKTRCIEPYKSQKPT